MDTGILTNVLQEFVRAFSFGYARILPDAHHLLWILATLEVVGAAMWWAFDDGQRVEKALLVKIMQVGFFIWVVSNYKWIVAAVVDGFIHTGTKAGGGTNNNLLQDPSTIIDWGFAATEPILAHLQERMLSAGLLDVIFSGLGALLVLLAYFGLAMSAFITYLEFYIVSLLGLILIPFGVFKHTSFLAEKVFGAVIAFGIRLMVLAFILAVIEPTLRQLALPSDPSFPQILTLFLTAFTIAVLSWHAPGIASGLMAGAPSLGAGTMFGTGLAAGAGIVGAGAAMGIGSAVSAAKHGLGQVAAASKAEITNASGRGGGAIGVSGGGHGRVGGGGAAGAWLPTAPAPSKPTPPAPNCKDPGMPAWAQNLMMAHHVIPQDAHPGAGMSAPIKAE